MAVTVATMAPRWSDPPPGSECARGPKHQTSRPQERAVRRAGQSASSAPLHTLGRCGVSPAEVGVEETAGGLRPGRNLPPTEPSTRSVEAPMISAIKEPSPSRTFPTFSCPIMAAIGSITDQPQCRIRGGKRTSPSATRRDRFLCTSAIVNGYRQIRNLT